MHPHPARLLSELRLLAGRPQAGASADSALLDRYVLQGDQDAFASLVARHGPMVLGVCRRLLPDPHLAEDACQAAFLVLARKAAAVRPGYSLPAWLHGVAHRVALKARSARARDRLRRARPLAAEPPDPGADPLAEVSARELLAAVDEEVGRLPEVYRLPVLLCCLGGHTQEEAARLLGWTPGSVQGRLERGRRRLRERLARRGLALSSALAAVEVSRAAAFPARLLGALAGSGAAVSLRAVALAEEALRGMAAGMWKAVAALALVAGALAAGAGALAPRPPADRAAPGRGALAGPPVAKAPRVDRHGDPLPPGAVARLGTVRLRHGGRVAGLTFSPDGKTLATSSDGLHDPVIRLWDVASGKELRRIPSPNPLSHFTSLAFSPDGRTLASGESGPFHRRAGEEVKAFVRLWDVATGKEKRARAWHTENVTSVAFSPDGKTLASCAYDRTVRLWDAATGRELHRCTGHAAAIYSVAFSPDGKTVASGGYDNLRLWDVATGKQLRAIEGARNPGVTTVAFSPDGTSLATGWGHTVRLLDTATGKRVREFKGHTKDVWAVVAFLPGGKSLVSAGRDGTVRVWEVATGRELRRVRADHDDFLHLALSADGKTLAAGGQGGTAHLWETATGKALHRFAGHTGSVLSLRYSPDGKALASGAGDGTVRLWDVRTGKSRTLREKGEWVGWVVFAPDGKTLLADDPFSLWDVASGTVVREFAGHGGGTTALALAPDGKTVASGGMDRLIRLWDAATGKELRRLAGHKTGVGELAFSPDGKLLASLGNYQDPERMVYLWDLARGKVVHRFGPALAFFGRGSLAFSPDGRSVTAVSDSETVRF